MLERLFSDYQASHQHPLNCWSHLIGIPVILLSLLGLLSQWILHEPTPYPLVSVVLFRVDAGIILLAPVLLFYFFLDWKLAVPFSFVALGLYFLGRTLPPPINLGLFAAGWILQFIGHSAFEKRAPAFATNLIHLLIGPLWVFAGIIGDSERFRNEKTS